MVELCRVDDRMLHGQVAVSWVNHIGPEAILIANDEVAANEMSKLAFKMAKPAGVKLAIKSIEGAISLLNDPRAAKTKIFVITKTVQDCLTLVKQTNGQIKKVNIGGVKKRDNCKQVLANVWMNDDDLKVVKELCDCTEIVEFQMVPSENRTNAKKML